MKKLKLESEQELKKQTRFRLLFTLKFPSIAQKSKRRHETESPRIYKILKLYFSIFLA